MPAKNNVFALLAFVLFFAIFFLPTYASAIQTNDRINRHLAAGGVLVTAGDFTEVTDSSGQVFSRRRLALTSLASGRIIASCLDFDGSVSDLAWDGGSIVWAAGSFQRACGVYSPGLMAFDLRTGRPFAWTNQFPDSSTQGLAYDRKLGHLYVTGNFSRVGSSARRFLAAYDRGGKLLSWAPVASLPPTSVDVDPATSLVYLGGTNIVNGKYRYGLAQVTPSGKGTLTSWAPKLEDPSAYVSRALFLSGKGVAILVGDITPRIQDDGHTVVAVSLATGAPVYGSGGYEFVGGLGNDAALLPDGNLLIAGYLSLTPGGQLLGAVRITQTGQVLQGWTTGLEANSPAPTDAMAHTLAPTGTGGYVIGGIFDFFGGAAAKNAAVILQ